ncbi:hypothetical protein EKO23_17425 [Nocardioides guangzhouensis]|uniref:Nitrogen fixation protein FixH n=1 Tax=Nocardioides guangzhouensis TaxID=2497878 RepID=A0A4Q4Z863_9ACTN|nr:hypothetical protein [Nocardioides guangzhouensis]RYP84057.1 hypothetical protein EKO23_17425 [Nocardioides guangzhouensis]
MSRMEQYLTSFSHGPGWWTVAIAIAALATFALMGTFLVAASRAYDRVPPLDRTTDLPADRAQDESAVAAADHPHLPHAAA